MEELNEMRGVKAHEKGGGGDQGSFCHPLYLLSEVQAWWLTAQLRFMVRKRVFLFSSLPPANAIQKITIIMLHIAD